jgi:hypothetical protein
MSTMKGYYENNNDPQEITAEANLTLVHPVSSPGAADVALRSSLVLIDPGGANRSVVLPPLSASQGAFAGTKLVIVNTADAGEDLAIHAPAGTTIATVGQNESAQVVAGTTVWYNVGVGKAT